MLEYLDGTDLHNTIRLLLRGGVAKIIVVEGEEDFDLLIEALQQRQVDVVPGYGKVKTLQAAAEAELSGTEPVRFLVDADFDHVTGVSESYPANVVATNHYDLVMDVSEHLPEINLRIARMASGKHSTASLSAEEQVALSHKIAERFGELRFASHVDGWNLSFSSFPFHTFLPSKVDDELDVASILGFLVTRTRNCELEPSDLLTKVPSHCASIGNRRMLVNSHDLLVILHQVGRSFGGARSNTGYDLQFRLAAAGSVSDVPVVSSLIDWAEAA